MTADLVDLYAPTGSVRDDLGHAPDIALINNLARIADKLRLWPRFILISGSNALIRRSYRAGVFPEYWLAPPSNGGCHAKLSVMFERW
jgi:hypothetical protein